MALPPRMQDRLYHDMILPGEAIDIRKKAREFAIKQVAPIGYQIAHTEETKDTFPLEIFRSLAQEDFFRIPFPKEFGGLGLKYPVCATVVTVEELAYVSNSIAAIYDVHCILAGHALMYGSEVLKQKYLRPMTLGNKIACFATTEPEASSELSPRTLKTTAT